MHARRALLSLAVLLPLAAPLAGAAPSSFFVNVVDAKSLGCSPDVFTPPDLRVTVYANDQQVLQTVEASDQASPLFAAVAVVQLAPPVKIGVEVQEGEPKGLTSETFIQCDAAPGGAVRFEQTWNGSATQTIAAKGDASNAASADVVVGYDAPARPVAAVSQVTSEGATLSWNATTSSAQRDRIAGPDGGPALALAGLGDSTYRLKGLCDDTDFAVRVVRDDGPWHVGSAEVAFHTPNAQPQPPVVMWAHVVNGTLDVQFAGLPHDAATLEFHEGNGSFAPSNATLVDSLTFAPGAPIASAGERVVPWHGQNLVMLVVSDQGGLSSRSEAVSVAAPARSVAPAPDDCLKLALPPPNRTVDTVNDTNGSATTTTPGDGQAQGATTPGGGSATSGSVPTWALVAGGFVLGVAVIAGVVLAMRKP